MHWFRAQPWSLSWPRFRLTILVAAAASVLMSCASTAPAVRSDFDPAFNFASVKTFGFPSVTGTDRGGYATLVTAHFKAAIEHEMTVRGYTFAAQNSDVLINFYSESADKTQVFAYPDAHWGVFYGRPRYYGWYSAWPFYYDPDVDVVTYKAGTFKIDMVDPARKQTVWEASVEERLTDQAQDNPQPTIARLVAEMFRKFPSGVHAQ